MFAVIKTGGKQYRVAADDVITVAKLDGEPGAEVTFGEVLMVTRDGKTELGAPLLSNLSVTGEVLEQARGPKVIAFKKRRRQNSKRKRGHRQDFTRVLITAIGDVKGERKARPRGKASEQAGDIALIDGIGPALKAKMEGAGYGTLAAIAALKAPEIEKLDEELSLGGRIAREEWVEQAKELLAGKPPRAKSDREAAKES